MARRKIVQDERYHDTLLLLKKYRDVVWSLSVSVEHAKSDFRECFGGSIEEFLESVYVAGGDLSGTDIEERAKCIERSNKIFTPDSRDKICNSHSCFPFLFKKLMFKYVSST